LRMALLQLFSLLAAVRWSESVRAIWAINAGGPAHRSVDGVVYNADIDEMPGTVSDHGVIHVPLLARVHPQDRILYQTERYHYENFGYNIPIHKNGDYVLNLKFSEVYFRTANQKVFDVLLNDQPVVVGIDIYSKVGYGTAHDEYVSFKIQDDSLLIGDYKLAFSGNLAVQFIKTPYDNPKVNAIVLYEGFVNEIPKLPPLQTEEEEIVQEEIIQEEINKPDPSQQQRRVEEQQRTQQQKKVLRPKKANPYDNEANGQYWPILISIGVFLPTVILLYNRQKAS